MMNIGIDKIGFATANYVLKLADLAEVRNIAPEKLSYLRPYISSNDWCTSSDMDEIELSINVTDPMSLITEINYHLGASYTIIPMSNYIHPREEDVT